MNSRWVQKQASALAQGVTSEASATPDRIRCAFVRCFSRLPEEAEIQLADTFFKTGKDNGSKQMTSFCQALLSSAEFRYAD